MLACCGDWRTVKVFAGVVRQAVLVAVDDESALAEHHRDLGRRVPLGSCWRKNNNFVTSASCQQREHWEIFQQRGLLYQASIIRMAYSLENYRLLRSKGPSNTRGNSAPTRPFVFFQNVALRPPHRSSIFSASG